MVFVYMVREVLIYTILLYFYFSELAALLLALLHFFLQVIRKVQALLLRELEQLVERDLLLEIKEDLAILFKFKLHLMLLISDFDLAVPTLHLPHPPDLAFFHVVYECAQLLVHLLQFCSYELPNLVLLLILA